jgi:hypothetical protein
MAVNNNIGAACFDNIFSEEYGVCLHCDLNPNPSPYKGEGLVGAKQYVVILSLHLIVFNNVQTT